MYQVRHIPDHILERLDQDWKALGAPAYHRNEAIVVTDMSLDRFERTANFEQTITVDGQRLRGVVTQVCRLEFTVVRGAAAS